MTFDRRPGFALPAVLTVTGVVTLIFLVAITALTSLTREANSARERVRFVQAALSAEATLQYLAATEPFDRVGFHAGAPRMLGYNDEAPLNMPSAGATSLVYQDGRPYEFVATGLTPRSVVLSLRDQAGMINLATLHEEQFVRLGNLIGLSNAFSRTLPALFRDYADADDLETINGAERIRYSDGGPANRALLRPAELLSVRGVREGIDASRWRDLRPELAVDSQRPQINVNTASATTLMVLFGISEQQAEATVRARDRAPLLSFEDFIAASGASMPYDGEQLLTFPSGAIVYTVADVGSPWRYRGRLVLTPTSPERPFWVDQTEMTEARGTAMATSDADRLPYTPR